MDVKTDIHPLCDRHLVQMRLIGMQQRMSANETWRFPVFRCTQWGCTRVFEAGGYFTIVDGERDLEGKLFIGCEHGAMFIARVEENDLVWHGCKAACTDRCERRTLNSASRFLRHAGAMVGLARDSSTRKGFHRF